LKDIDTAEEIVEYVQPYIGSVIKSRDFAQNFIAKRKQLLKAEVIKIQKLNLSFLCNSFVCFF